MITKVNFQRRWRVCPDSQNFLWKIDNKQLEKTKTIDYRGFEITNIEGAILMEECFLFRKEKEMVLW